MSNAEDNTPEVETEWTDLGTDPDYIDLVVDEEAPDFADPRSVEKTVPYSMTRRVKEGSEGALVVEFDLPGVRASDIAVRIEGDKIEVRACRPDQPDVDAAVFTVPDWDLVKTAAWTEEGVLRIRIPRAPFLQRDVFVKSR